jgi:hypothetical protein
MRGCSTRITTPSAYWVGCRGAGFATTCAPPSTRSDGARSARSTRASRPWSATFCSRPSSAIQPPDGRRGRSRRTFEACAPSTLAADAELPSLPALNDWLETRCRELWAEISHGGSVADVWREEAQHLVQLPRPFDGFVEYTERVSPTCLIHLERNRSSVPASFANRPKPNPTTTPPHE